MKIMQKFLSVILCALLMLSMGTAVFAAQMYTAARADKVVTVVGDTLTVILSAPEAVDVSSLGVSVTAEGYEVVEGKWLLTGIISDYDYEKDKGAFTFGGGAHTLSGDYFRLTLRAVTARPDNSPVSVLTIAKNGADTVFQETVTLSAQKIICKEGEHTFGPYEISQTQHLHQCTTCGHTENGAHKWDEGAVTKEPTCTADGIITYTCTVCKAVKTEPVKKAGHSYGGWKYTDETSHSKVCSACRDTVTEAHRWDGGKITTPATCVHPGVKTYTCTSCGGTRTEKIAQLSHTYDNDCDSSCNVCGASRNVKHTYASKWSMDKSGHWHSCTRCGAKGDQAAHTASGWVVDKAAGEMTAGSRHKACTVCGMVLETESIPATGCTHKGGTEVRGAVKATCTEDGYSGDTVCKTCQTVLKKGEAIPKLGHTPVNGVCTACGKVLEEDKPTQPVPTAHAPTETFPTETAPTQTEPTPTESEPTQPAATEPPAQIEPVEPPRPSEPDGSTVPETAPPRSDGNGSNAGRVVLAVLGIAAVLAAFLFGILVWRKRRQ